MLKNTKKCKLSIYILMSIWLSDSTANRINKTYFKGFVDISDGNVFVRNGDISLNGRFFSNGDVSINQRLFVSGDVSFNGNVVVSKDILILGRLSVQQYSSEKIINTTTTNYTFIVSQDLSLNNTLFVGGDISVNRRLFVSGDVSLNGNVYIVKNTVLNGDVSLNNRLFVGGDLSVNRRLFVSGDVSLNGNVYIVNNTVLNGDVSFNKRLYVGGDVSFNKSLYVGYDSSINGNLTVTLNVTAQSFNATSDYRIKDFTEELNTNHIVDNIRPIEYVNTILNKKDLGILAHELQEIYPFLVTGTKDSDEYQSINYIGLIGILIKEIQELKKRVSFLEK